MIIQSIRLLLVEDHLMMRAALRLMLSAQPNLQIVGETGSCESAINMAFRLRPHIVLLDLFLSDNSSLECIPQLIEAGAHILVLTGSADEDYHKRAVEVGALGIVRKEQPVPVLLEAIERVYNGFPWRDPVLPDLRELNRDSSAPSNRRLVPAGSSLDATGIASLTPREREVIQLIAEGLRNKQLAQRLSVSEKTVHNHLASIFRKLEVRDRLELAAFARRNHLIGPPSVGPGRGEPLPI